MQQASLSLPFAPCSRSSAALPPECLRPTSPSQTRKYCFPAPSCETTSLLGLAHTYCRRSPPHFYASNRLQALDKFRLICPSGCVNQELGMVGIARDSFPSLNEQANAG